MEDASQYSLSSASFSNAVFPEQTDTSGTFPTLLTLRCVSHLASQLKDTLGTFSSKLMVNHWQSFMESSSVRSFQPLLHNSVVPNLRAVLVQDYRNVVILLLTLFTITLCHRLGSLAKAVSPSQTPSSTPDRMSLITMIKRPSRFASQPSLHQDPRSIQHIERPPSLPCTYDRHMRSYKIMSEVLEQFIICAGSFWPYYYYDRWNIGEWSRLSFPLSRNVVMGHLRSGLVVLRDSSVSYEDVTKREWGGLTWVDELQEVA